MGFVTGAPAASIILNHNYSSYQSADLCEERGCIKHSNLTCSICKKKICEEHRLMNKGHHCKNDKFEIIRKRLND
jgi:hypothetical protein